MAFGPFKTLVTAAQDQARRGGRTDVYSSGIVHEMGSLCIRAGAVPRNAHLEDVEGVDLARLEAEGPPVLRLHKEVPSPPRRQRLACTVSLSFEAKDLRPRSLLNQRQLQCQHHCRA